MVTDTSGELGEAFVDPSSSLSRGTFERGGVNICLGSSRPAARIVP